MSPDRHRTAWDAAYDADLARVLLARIRGTIVLCLLGLGLAVVAVQVVADGDGDLRVRFIAALGVVAAAIGIGTLVERFRDRVRALALSFALAVVAVLAAYARSVPDGVSVASAAFVALNMGFAILLPWGAGPQIIIGTATSLAFAVFAFLDPSPLISALVSVVVSSAGVAVVGATMLERYRRTSFTRTWQQERLVALGHDLQAPQSAEEVGIAVGRHALTHLPASVVAVAVRAEGIDAFRVVSVGGVHATGFGHLNDIELPASSPLLAEILARPYLQMPEGAPTSELAQLFAEHPDARSLYIALRHGTEVEGIVAWTRTQVGFSHGEIELLPALASQAALALKTARALAELRQMNRLKSEFVSTVSHELRTPLNVILGYAEMARDGALDDGDRRDCLDRIDSSGRELLDLIESTLEVGRLDAAQSAVRLESVRLGAFWSALGAACQAIPRIQGVDLLWEDAPVVTVTSDPHKLTVIVRNLVGNACKFTPHGSVSARLALEDGAVVLEVIDTGIGIAAEDRELIFDLFRQSDSSDSRRYGGTGLGLYIVKRFAEQLGGSVALESSPGTGSHFTVRVPIARSDVARDAA